MAGTGEQVAASLQLAEQYKAELQARGVSVIPAPIFDSNPDAALDSFKQQWLAEVASLQDPKVAEAARSECRSGCSCTSTAGPEALIRAGAGWIVFPRRLPEWSEWMKKQMELAGVARERAETAGGVYLSLRLDGRIRGSGVGIPKWSALSVQLPLTDKWGGFLDGFDGSVRSFD